MTIRRASHTDMNRLYELVEELHAASEYPAREIDLSPRAVRELFQAALAHNGHTGSGGTLLNLYEKDGKAVGFMLGGLQRVYHICNRLEAQDFFLYCSPEAPARASSQLLDAFIEWALGNPKVADIVLSSNDVAGADPEKLGKMFARKGFTKRGEIWKRTGQ